MRPSALTLRVLLHMMRPAWNRAAVSPDASAASRRASAARSGLRTHEASCPVNPEPYILDLRARLSTSAAVSPDASAVQHARRHRSQWPAFSCWHFGHGTLNLEQYITPG